MVKLAALWLPLVLVLVSSFGIDIQAECHGTIHGGATVKNGGSGKPTSFCVDFIFVLKIPE